MTQKQRKYVERVKASLTIIALYPDATPTRAFIGYTDGECFVWMELLRVFKRSTRTSVRIN